MGFVKRHPVGCLLALACVLLVLVMQSCSSSLVTLGTAPSARWGPAPILARTGICWGPEAAYCDLEAELSDYLDSYESTHDYDEYHFDLDEIEHDPYVLLSCCARSMRASGRLTRWRALCKHSLTASTF